ncbi:MAG TPA: hypothetical protein VHE35_09815 [Kofleriaceae bacterium]|nr:hypothetical protein [Kofleriaceae bacterium]
MTTSRLTLLALLVGCGGADAIPDATAPDAATVDTAQPDGPTDGVILGTDRFRDTFERAALGAYWACNGAPCQVPGIVGGGVATPTSPSSRWAWARTEVASPTAIASGRISVEAVVHAGYTGFPYLFQIWLARTDAGVTVYAMHYNDRDDCTRTGGPGCLGKWEIKYDGATPGCVMRRVYVFDRAGALAAGDRIALTLVRDTDGSHLLRGYRNGVKMLEVDYTGVPTPDMTATDQVTPCAAAGYPLLAGSRVGWTIANTPGTAPNVPLIDEVSGAWGDAVTP